MSNPETLTALPPVAKSFFSFCKKCDADRYHTVVAHKSATSAKLKCEVCGAASTFSLPKATASKSATGAKKGPTRGAKSEAARRSAYTSKYDLLVSENSKGNEHPYTMKGKFDIHQRIAHPKFGLGVVTAVFTDKVEVHFADETRVLIHNRTT